MLPQANKWKAEREKKSVADDCSSVMFLLQQRRGRENAITRAELSRRLTLSDREIRACIETLRTDHPMGGLICSSSSSAGYWLAEDLSEIKEVYRERRGQALRMMWNARRQLASAERYFAEQAAFETAEFKQMELIA